MSDVTEQGALLPCCLAALLPHLLRRLGQGVLPWINRMKAALD